MTLKKAATAALLLLIVIAALTGCTGGGERERRTAEVTPKMSTLTSELLFSEKPLLDKPVKLTLIFKTIINATNATAMIEIPEGFELVSGNVEWNGSLNAEEMQEVEAVVMATKMGYYEFRGTASASISPSYQTWHTDRIYLEVSQNDAIIGSMPEQNWYEPMQLPSLPVEQENEGILGELEISGEPELGKELTLTYRVTVSNDNPEQLPAQISLVFPPKAFKLGTVRYPEDGTTAEEGGKPFATKSQLGWIGNLRKGQTYEIRATFKVVTYGSGYVYGNTLARQGNITSGGHAIKIAQLHVDKYGGNFSAYNTTPTAVEPAREDSPERKIVE